MAPLPHLTPEQQASVKEHTSFLFTVPNPTSYTSIPLPYLPIPHPTLSLALTAPQHDDIPHQVATLNDPLVALNLAGPPYPYSNEDATSYNASRLEILERHMLAWSKGDYSYDGSLVQECPLTTLRLGEKGEGLWIGDMCLCRSRFDEVDDLAERESLMRINQLRKVGDKDLVWTIGYYLSPVYQKQSIVTHAVPALLHSFALHLQVHRIKSSGYLGNEASKAVQLKNGFKVVGEFARVVDESRGGHRRGLWETEWTRSED